MITMTHTTESSRALELLNEFGQMGNIAPSPEWEQSVLQRIQASHYERKKGQGGLRLITTITCFLAATTCISIKTIYNSTNRKTEKREALQQIEKELLVNSYSSI